MTDEEIARALNSKASSSANSAILARAALNDLLTNNYSWIVRMCFYELNNQADAFDCAQEVMVQIIKSVGSFDSRSNIRTWMYTVTRRTIYRYRNKRKSFFERFISLNKDNDSRDEALQITQATQESDFELSQQKKMLLECLGKLPEKQRQVVVLHYFEDLPLSEIAAYLKCSIGTVKTHLHRARKKLALMLKDVPDLSNSSAVNSQREV